MPPNCEQDSVNEVLCLEDILQAFNTPVSVDVAWALCYQCAKCFDSALVKNREKCYVPELQHVFIQAEGNVHPKTIYGDANDGK